MIREMKLLLTDGVTVNGVASQGDRTALHTAAGLGVPFAWRTEGQTHG
jgi:hypothetical protein